MRTLYSYILLFSFLTGVLQPALPLIEYHIFKESIIERFCINREVPELQCDGVCYLTTQIAESQARDSDPLSLDTDYYPIAVHYARAAHFDGFLKQRALIEPAVARMISHPVQPNAPPPRTA